MERISKRISFVVPPYLLMQTGDFSAQPLLDELFSSPTPDQALQRFRHCYRPVQSLGTGRWGMVYLANVHVEEPRGSGIYRQLYQWGGRTLTAGSERSASVFGASPVQVAVKIQFGGAHGEPDPYQEKRIRAENSVYDYVDSVFIGRGGNPFTVTSPFVKVFSAFDVQVDLREFVRTFRNTFTEEQFLHSFVNDWLPELPGPRARGPLAEWILTAVEPGSNELILNLQVSEYANGGSLAHFLSSMNPDPKVSQQLITQALCTLYLLHRVGRATHYDSRPVNFFLKRVSNDVVMRYDLAPNLTLFFQANMTNGLVPVLGDFGSAVIDTLTNLDPNSPYGSRSKIVRVDRMPGTTWVGETPEKLFLQNPNFDTQLFVREALSIVPLSVARGWAEGFRLMMLDMTVPETFAPLWQEYHGESTRIDKFYEFYQEAAFMSSGQFDAEITPERWAKFQALANSIKWYMFAPSPGDFMIRAIENYYRDVFWTLAQPLPEGYYDVRDFGLKIGHVSGGTLPLLKLDV